MVDMQANVEAEISPEQMLEISDRCLRNDTGQESLRLRPLINANTFYETRSASCPPPLMPRDPLLLHVPAGAAAGAAAAAKA